MQLNKNNIIHYIEVETGTDLPLCIHGKRGEGSDFKVPEYLIVVLKESERGYMKVGGKAVVIPELGRLNHILYTHLSAEVIPSFGHRQA